MDTFNVELCVLIVACFEVYVVSLMNYRCSIVTYFINISCVIPHFALVHLYTIVDFYLVWSSFV